MQKYLLSVVFGLGQAVSARSTPSHICNNTHVVYETKGGSVLRAALARDANLPQQQLARQCGVEAMDGYGRRTSVTWGPQVTPSPLCGHALCDSTPMGTVAHSDGKLVLEGIVIDMRPNFEVTHVVASKADVFVAGENCVHSSSIGRTACVKDPNFTVVGAAADNDTVYVFGGEHGDVYAFHHVAAPSRGVEAITGVHMRGKTWQFLPAVPAASMIDTTCMPKSPGKPTALSIENGMLFRHYESAVIASAIPPKTAATVWLPYFAASEKICESLPEEPCAWHEWHSPTACRARRQCTSLGIRPIAELDYSCGRARRQYNPPSPFPPPSSSTTNNSPPPSLSTTNNFPSAPPTFVLNTVSDSCDNNDYLIPVNPCVPPVQRTCAPRPDSATAVSISAATSNYTALAELEGQEASTVTCAENYFARSGQCLPCEQCSTGTYLVTPCTATEDVVCAACKRGTYQPKQWHLERACHVSNGCPGGDRSKNGICRSTSFNYNTLWAMALPLYGGIVMVVKT